MKMIPNPNANKKKYKYEMFVYRSEDEESELLAYSTLPIQCNGSLVEIHTVKNSYKAGKTDVRLRMWLHDILDDEGILYRVEIAGYYVTRKRFVEIQRIYVENKNQKKVRRLISEFNNKNNIVQEDIDEGSMCDNIEDGLPQIKCPSCGKEIDFDYTRCPYCKNAL